MSALDNHTIEILLGPWEGPFGGLPPLDRATPPTIEAAYRIALDRKRAEVRAITANTCLPSFENTIEALENAGRYLRRVETIRSAFKTTLSVGDMPDIDLRIAPLGTALEDEIAHDEVLFARIEAVYQARLSAGLTPEQQRLTEVIHQRFQRQGAGLSPDAKARLSQINARLAELGSTFSQNLVAEQARLVVFLDDETELEGLSESQRLSAATAAETHGRKGGWALPIDLPMVWAVLAAAANRDLRERVWRLWNGRGQAGGPFDNRPVAAEMLKLRGEKARLLGFPDFARFAMAERMAGTPETAMALLQQVWPRVRTVTESQIAELQALADREGASFRLAPWDRRYYAEKLRQARFGLDAQAVRAYLQLDNVLNAIFDAAERLHGLTFNRLPDAPVQYPDIRVYEVRRAGVALGVLWLDLFARQGKMRGSWQAELRCHETFSGNVLPLAMVASNLPPPQTGKPILIGWEIANVLFHEFGHAMHTLMSKAAYPSLGSMSVAWDFIELPSQLNERWLLDRDLLRKHMRHHESGEPIPMAIIDAIEQGAHYDRIFTLTLDGLFTAITDLKIHMAADGGMVDATTIEEQTLAELNMPHAVDLTIRAMTSVHTFVSNYAAGMYSYLWADVLAADVADAFIQAPGGLYDEPTAERWRRDILTAGAGVPADEAFQRFLGRHPHPQALLRRFGLDTVQA